ncbi:MAG: C2H2-type zinc finger protein [Dehalococcoidia bacterium]|jgi:DNA-directed RNA polymerase subunit M/transcription elongation factor TFIIS
MNKIRRIPTCDQCGKRFKTTQGLGGHRVLYHRSNKDGEHDTTLDKAGLDHLVSRLSSIEEMVKGLQIKTLQNEKLPIGLWVLAVCLKCGTVLQYDRTYRKGALFESDHFECPHCGAVQEVTEVISRQKVNAKEWGKDTPEEKEAKNS